MAEEIAFKEITTGAENDFSKATKIVRAMVTEYGMSDLGPLQLEQQEGAAFLGRDYNKSKNFSDAVALEIDQEVRKIINSCYEEGENLLKEQNKNAKILEEKYGISAEIIDARSIVPFNYEKVIESVKKTGKIILVGDACERNSVMRDMASNITEMCFDDLDAPPVVIGAKNWITPPFEFDEYFFPQASWILDAIHQQIMPLEGYEAKQNFSEEEKVRCAKAGV